MLKIAIEPKIESRNPAVALITKHSEKTKSFFADLLKQKQTESELNIRKENLKETESNKATPKSETEKFQNQESVKLQNKKKEEVQKADGKESAKELQKNEEKDFSMKDVKSKDNKRKKVIQENEKAKLVEKILEFLSDNKKLLKELYQENHKANETFQQFVKNLQNDLTKIDPKNLKMFLQMLTKKIVPKLSSLKQVTLQKQQKSEEALFKVSTNEKNEKKIHVNPHKVKVVDYRTNHEHHEQESPKQIKIEPKDNAPKIQMNQTFSIPADESLSKVNMSQKFKTLDFKNPVQASQQLVKYAKMILTDKKSTMQLDLKPDALGKILLKVELVNHKIQAQIMTSNDFAGDLLKQNMGHLQNAFKEAGLNLDFLNVDVSSDQQNQNSEQAHFYQDNAWEKSGNFFAAEEVNNVYEMNNAHIVGSINYVV